MIRTVLRCLSVCVLVFYGLLAPLAAADPDEAPAPLLSQDLPVHWWFVFKLNAAKFPGCGGSDVRACPFGGSVRDYGANWSQQFVYASSTDPTLHQGSGCLGDGISDPVGATFNAIYNGNLNFVVWNDQFYRDPAIKGCSDSCSAPWGHSKGVLAWDDTGKGFVMQVTTPSWPGAGNSANPRTHDGNTLGCIIDNNVKVSQHAFALQLTKDDVVAVLQALGNASVVTDISNPQIVKNGGPDDIVALVNALGVKSDSKTFLKTTLSDGTILLSKPSALPVPPWQMVSSLLGGIDLRAATWWTNPAIDTTTADSPLACWDASLTTKPGGVEIAKTGQWNGVSFNLTGGPGNDRNHAKIGVSTDATVHTVIFGDMNQQGNATDPARKCSSSQNGRGGLFFVRSDPALWQSVNDLITAPPDSAAAPASDPAP